MFTAGAAATRLLADDAVCLDASRDECLVGTVTGRGEPEPLVLPVEALPRFTGSTFLLLGDLGRGCLLGDLDRGWPLPVGDLVRSCFLGGGLATGPAALFRLVALG